MAQALTYVRDDRYPRCSDAEYARRHALVHAAMADRNLDSLIVYGGYRNMYQQNLKWLTNYSDSFQAYAVFPAEGEPSVYNAVYPHLLFAKRQSVFPRTEWGGPKIAVTVASRLQELGLEGGRIGYVGIDSNRTVSIPHSHYQTLTELLPGVALEDVTSMFERLRFPKSSEEVQFVERGAAITNQVMNDLIAASRPGVWDYELFAEIQASALRHGGDNNFALLASTSMTAPDMPYPYPQPAHRQIQDGDLILNELCANYQGYSGQLIRPIALGEPPKELRHLYDIAVELFYAVRAAIAPGNSTDDVLAAVGTVERKHDFAIEAPIVHGWDNMPQPPQIGLPGGEREWPRTPHVFSEGELMMIEPNPTTRDRSRGIFFGSLCVVTADGCRDLHQFPDDFVVVRA